MLKEGSINEKKLFVLKDFTNTNKFNKTKDTINLLNVLKLEKHSLLILDGADKQSIQSTTNIPNISSLSSDLINAPAIARSEYIIITEKGLTNLIENRLNKKLKIKINKTKKSIFSCQRLSPSNHRCIKNSFRAHRCKANY